MSGTITAPAGFFQNDAVSPTTAVDLETVVATIQTTNSTASASATAAASSATAAANSATAASNSATTANTAATNASSSATSAANSATSAATSATNASNSATSAASSASSAASSATSAASSATNAASSATSASTSATNAANSATTVSSVLTAAGFGGSGGNATFSGKGTWQASGQTSSVVLSGPSDSTPSGEGTSVYAYTVVTGSSGSATHIPVSSRATITQDTSNFVWSVLGTVGYSPATNLSSTAEHVGVYGQAVRNNAGTAGLWGMTAEVHDFTNAKSSTTGYDIGIEVDVISNHVDDGNKRTGITVVLEPAVAAGSGGVPVEAANAISTYASSDARQFKNHLNLGGNYGVAAINLRNAYDNGFGSGSRPTLTAAASAATTVSVSNVLPFTSDQYGRDVNGGFNAIVYIGGVAYIQTGYAVTGSGPAGTLTLSSACTAASGTSVVNNSHTVWLGQGSDIAFDYAGTLGIPVSRIYGDGVNLNVQGPLKVSGALGIHGVSPPSQPTITGSRSTATVSVVQQILSALASYGLIIDSTTA